MLPTATQTLYEIHTNTYVNQPYLDKLLKRREYEIKGINLMYDGIEHIMNTPSSFYNPSHSLMTTLINVYGNTHISSLNTFFTREEAILNNDCLFWDQYLESSNLKSFMDSESYTELVNRFKTRNKENHIPFDKDTVYAFISNITAHKDSIFATKLEKALLKLDKGYVSNTGNTLNGLLVISAPSYCNYLNYEKVWVIDDIRTALRQILPVESEFIKTDDLLNSHKGDDWCSYDDDLLRLKYFQNGNVHILLSDLAYEKIVETLYHLKTNVLDMDVSKIKRKPYKYNGYLK